MLELELFDGIFGLCERNSLEWRLITETSAQNITTTNTRIFFGRKLQETEKEKKNERAKKACELKMHHKFYLLLCESQCF